MEIEIKDNDLACQGIFYGVFYGDILWGKTTLLKLMPGPLDPNRRTMVLKERGVPSALSIVELHR